jgi:hypothetical protein
MLSDRKLKPLSPWPFRHQASAIAPHTGGAQTAEKLLRGAGDSIDMQMPSFTMCERLFGGDRMWLIGVRGCGEKMQCRHQSVLQPTVATSDVNIRSK